MFPIAHVPVIHIDTLHVRITASTEYSNIEGFLFTWRSVTPIINNYYRDSLTLLSILSAYMLVIFIRSLQKDSEWFTHLLLVIVGLLGVLSSNPLSRAFPAKEPRLADHVFLAVFVGAYRLFLFLELEILRTRSSTPSPILVLILIVAFGFYIKIDVAASFDRATQAFGSPFHRGDLLESETVAIWTHAVYFPVSIIYFCFAWLGNDGINLARLIFFGVSVSASSVTTLVTRVRAVQEGWWPSSIVPAIVYASVHATLAGAALFLMHSGMGTDYKGLEAELAGAGPTGLDIERESDHAEPDGFVDGETGQSAL
jgi:hypothetical protein